MKTKLLFILMLCGIVRLGFAQYSGTGTFTRINSLAELTDGYYVITNETNQFLMTNGRSGTATTGYFLSANATPVAGDIINPTTANVWLIETNGSARTIYNEPIDRYVGYVSGNAASIEATVANSSRWAFSFAGGRFTVNNVNTPVRQLSYNPSAPRFAAYGNTGQEELQLYKLTATVPLTTEVQFASATYSIGENNTSVSICVDIANPSASAATTVQVALSGSAAPHLSYTTQTLSFPANSSAQRCVTIPIANNSVCGDSNDYTFVLQTVSGGSSASIGTQSSTTLSVSDEDGVNGAFKTLSFEAGDDWNYTGNGAVNTTANKYYGTQSYRLTASNAITTDNISIAGINNVSLQVAFASEGVDSGEDLFLDISYDNGGTWTGAGSIKLVDGFSNASLNMGSTNAVDPTTVPSNPYSISINPAETQIRVRLRAVGLDANEYYFVDDIILSGNSCTTVCTPTHTVTNFAPSTGPVGTEVTITGSGFSAASIVRFNGILATAVTFVNSTTLVAEVPSSAATGPLSVEEGGCELDTSTFTLLSNLGSCGNLSDLIMTEIYDENGGSLGYIEVYNGTGAPINLTNYFVRRYGDAGELAANNYTDYYFSPSINSIANGQVLYGKISTDADVATPDFSFSQTGFAGINGDDIFHLYRGSTLIDVYIVPNSNIGFTARRRLTTTGPNTTSTPSDWTHTTTDNVTGDLGLFPYTALSSFPSVTIPVDVSSCSAIQAQFTAVGTPGASGTLTYRWYYNNGSSAGWSQVTAAALPLATITGQTTNTLTLSGNFYSYVGYQFYCLVTENGSCAVVSNAAQIKISTTTWNGTTWTPSIPDLNTVAIINGDYNTGAGGQETSFSACQLIVNPSYFLNVANSTYVEVQNYATIYGEILVETHGSFVQRTNLSNGFVVPSGGTASVNKSTATVYNWYDYTYWSSPVSGATVGAAIDIAPTNRRFYYEAANYLDVFAETGNNNASVPGHDDIDDNGDDWQLAPAGMLMTPGQGFAATVLNSGPFPGTRQITFSGPYNTGNITTPIFWNGNNGDNDWNLIGNPYPSAISFNDLYDSNTAFIDGAAYLWSQASPPLNNNNGNQNQNFNLADYAIISRFSGNIAGGDGITPNNFIPSGQSFFVKGLSNGMLSFNNNMRMADATSNNQFFRTNDTSNRLWLNLTSDNGVFNQVLIAYVDGATSGDDGMAYDAQRNLSSGVASILYTMMDDDNRKFAIQGKHPNSLTLDEIIPLGFYTSITQPTSYKLSIADVQGTFMTSNTIYLKDNLLGITMNLADNDYTFSSGTGVFNERFEIVFRDEALSVDGNDSTPSGLSIVELPNGDVQFTVGNHLEIRSVDIIDMLGRTLYQLQGNSSSETYTLSNLSQAAYIAKIRLSNGQVLTKRAIKRH